MTTNQTSELESKATTANLTISLIDGLVQQISGLFMCDQLADVEFIVEKERIPAHRIILAARSEYFRAMLYGGLSEAHKKEIELSEVPLTAFKTLIKYLYTGELRMSLGSDYLNTLLELLDLANLYRLEDLVLVLSGDLCKRICTDNVCVLLNSACLYNLTNVQQKCLSYFDSNGLLMLQQDSINTLTMDSFIEVIKRDSFFVPEVEIFKAVLRWKQHNPEIGDMQPLISYVRFPLMKAKTIVTDVRDSGIIEDSKIIEIIKKIETPNCLLLRDKFGVTCIKGKETETNVFEGRQLIFELAKEAQISSIQIFGDLQRNDYHISVYHTDWERCTGSPAVFRETVCKQSFLHIFPARTLKLIRLESRSDGNIRILKPRVWCP